MHAATPMHTTSEGDSWSRRRLWVLRSGVALFALQLVTALGDTSHGSRAIAAAVRSSVRGAAAAVWPSAVDWIEQLAARSDAHAVLLWLAADTLLAIVIAAMWTATTRANRHDRLAGAMRTTLRYLVGVVMCVYGGLKVVPVQFPTPAAEDLLRPLGDRSPMALLWAFMGTSPAYTVFSGVGELIGGALLFWRRTTTLGALILIGVLANVVMLNFAYDVPVKRAATLLLIAAVGLASRDASRLARILILDLPTAPGHEPPFAAGPRMRLVRRVLKPLIVVLAIAGPLGAALALRRSQTTKGPLDGVYSVERFVCDGTERPPLRTDAIRWWRVVIGDRGSVVVESASGRCERFRPTVNDREGTLTLTTADGSSSMRFRYENTTAQLRLVSDGGPIAEVVLRPLSAATVFRVLR